MALTTKLSVNLALSTKATADLGSNSGTRALAIAVQLVNGTGAGQGDVAFTDTATIAASADEDLDLAGALVGVDGGAAVFARVKALVVVADDDNTNTVVVSRPTTTGFPLFAAAEDAIALRPGQFLITGVGADDATGLAVTAGTGDIINIANGSSGTSVTYSIAIVGCSA